jgi:hypothetical protein
MAISKEQDAPLLSTYISIEPVQRQELSTVGVTSRSADTVTKDRELESDKIFLFSLFSFLPALLSRFITTKP